jgi:nicotinamide-nucleotide amidase
MKAEIIAIGTELTSGRNLDTNSQWLSLRLAAIGIPVHFHTTLSDDLDDNVSAFQAARDRADLVLITGGLGPTQDDLTRDALARLAGVELVFHEPSFEHIKQLFASRGRTMPDRNRVQALFPAGSEPIPNAMGTAPGIWMTVRRPGGAHSTFIAMPGVPTEMHAMYETSVRPRLLTLPGRAGVIVERKINCFGVGESAVEEKVADLTRRGHVPEVGITASDATISLRILAQAADEAAARSLIAPVEQTIRDRLGAWVFGADDEDLHDVVVRLLQERRLTVAVAESLTGGLVAHRLTLVPGVSANLMGAVVAYDNRVKTELLGVPEGLLAEHGAVSAPVAEAMAAGCRERFGVDVAVSTTGIAGPTGATPAKPVGLVYTAVAWPGGVRSAKFHWFGTRAEIQSRAAKMALNLLRLHLLGVR